MGAVVPTYNLPELPHTIRFTPEALAGIFLGDIKTWNDPKIASANADSEAPRDADRRGAPIRRQWHDLRLGRLPLEGLAGLEDEGRNGHFGQLARGSWGKGNEGVAGTVRQTPGSIGYVEITYALQNKMPIGPIKNQAGNFIEPSIESVTAAAAGVLSTIPDDLRYSITNSPGEKAWPVSGTTWAVVYQDMPAGPERTAVVGFLRWALHDGQALCGALDYAPLPAELVQRANAKLDVLEPPR